METTQTYHHCLYCTLLKLLLVTQHTETTVKLIGQKTEIKTEQQMPRTVPVSPIDVINIHVKGKIYNVISRILEQDLLLATANT